MKKLKVDKITYGVQAVMYYSGNCGCEAEWFCNDCPFKKTFCDKNAEAQTASEKLCDEAEKWLKEHGIEKPWEANLEY